jgi:hypothetical protein
MAATGLSSTSLSASFCFFLIFAAASDLCRRCEQYNRKRSFRIVFLLEPALILT